MDKLDAIKKKIEEIQAKSAVSTEMRAFITLVLSIITKQKEELANLSAENIATIQKALEFIQTEHSKMITDVTRETSTTIGVKDEMTAKMDKSIKEMKKMCEEMMLKKPMDGINPTPEEVVPLVLAKLPKPEPVILDTAEIIADKLETLKGEERLSATAIKDLPSFIERSPIPNGGGWRNLFQLHDVSVLSPTDKQVLTYNSTTKLWEPGSGTGLIQWGEITGTLSNQTDLQTALNAKASLALNNLASVAMNASLQWDNTAARTLDIASTANTVVGRALTISAGSTVTAGTDNMAGGNLTLNSGLGKGTGASSIIFQTGRTLTTGSTLQTLTTAMTILGSSNVGIGTTSPAYRLDVKGTTSANGIRSDMGFDIYQVPDPAFASISGVVSAGGSVNTGDHWYGVTYTTAVGETHITYTTAVVSTTAGNNTVTLTIPVSTDPRVTGRKIYRTKAGQPLYAEYLLTTIGNNTETSYVDTTADASLTGTAGLIYFKVNTTSYNISVGGVKSLTLDSQGTFIGTSAGAALTTGGRNVFIGQSAGVGATTTSDSVLVGNFAGSAAMTGGGNVLLGSYSGRLIVAGGSNLGVGAYSLFSNVSGMSNVAVGNYAGQKITGQNNTYLGVYTGSTGTAVDNNVMLGYYSGKYETAGSKLFIDSIDRGTEAAGRTNSLIYGVFDATPTNQILTINGNLGIGMAPVARVDVTDVTLAGSGSLAGSVLNLAQTWNTTGIPTAIKLNVTNTASGTASLLMDLQVATVSQFKVSKAGVTTQTGASIATQFKVSALNTAPANATDTGVLGEIRIVADYIYVCSATNVWVRSALTTW